MQPWASVPGSVAIFNIPPIYSQLLVHTKPSDSGGPGKSLASLGAESLHVVNSEVLL